MKATHDDKLRPSDEKCKDTKRGALRRLVVNALTSSLMLSGAAFMLSCTASNSSNPAWPQQPSPSYPNPSDTGSASPLGTNEAGQEFISSDKSAQDAHSHSRLAKQYSDKKVLDVLKGSATYYADSLAGNHTANGDIYDPKSFTAAHKKLRFGTIVRVVRLDTGAETYVRINDRGPFGSADRIIDLSKVAAKQLDMMRAGVVKVRVEILERPDD